MKIIQSRLKENAFLEEFEVLAGNGYSEQENCVVNVFDDVEYQKIMGFGAAITESAAYNYSLLSDEQKQEFLEKYYGSENGLNYNIGRLHINSCDFSLDIYDYVQPGDNTLKTFNIDRDRKYIIPMVKDIQKYCNHDLFFFASPWTPPAYMKDNESPIKGGKLKEEYKKLWAQYFAKYIKEYRKEGINISAVTVQNEPKAIQTWESCFYSPEDEKDLLKSILS